MNTKLLLSLALLGTIGAASGMQQLTTPNTNIPTNAQGFVTSYDGPIKKMGAKSVYKNNKRVSVTATLMDGRVLRLDPSVSWAFKEVQGKEYNWLTRARPLAGVAPAATAPVAPSLAAAAARTIKPAAHVVNARVAPARVTPKALAIKPAAPKAPTPSAATAAVKPAAPVVVKPVAKPAPVDSIVAKPAAPVVNAPAAPQAPAAIVKPLAVPASQLAAPVAQKSNSPAVPLRVRFADEPVIPTITAAINKPAAQPAPALNPAPVAKPAAAPVRTNPFAIPAAPVAQPKAPTVQAAPKYSYANLGKPAAPVAVKPAATPAPAINPAPVAEEVITLPTYQPQIMTVPAAKPAPAVTIIESGRVPAPRVQREIVEELTVALRAEEESTKTLPNTVQQINMPPVQNAQPQIETIEPVKIAPANRAPLSGFQANLARDMGRFFRKAQAPQPAVTPAASTETPVLRMPVTAPAPAAPTPAAPAAVNSALEEPVVDNSDEQQAVADLAALLKQLEPSWDSESR